MPLVSVVIPVYNGEKVIEACLRSVMAQTDADMEIIVVDDGSTDETWTVLQRMANQDGRIRPIHQANGGVSAARNAALACCHGEYIRFVDADDVLPPGSIQALLRCAQGCDLVIAGYTEVMGPMRQGRCLRHCEETMTCDDMLPHMNRWSNSFYYGVLWNKLFRREVIQREQVQFISGLNWGEDFAFVCRYLAGAQQVRYTSALVYDYQRNPEGMTVQQFFRFVFHPLASIRVKLRLYRELKELFIRRGAYARHRATLWLYMIRATLRN